MSLKSQPSLRVYNIFWKKKVYIFVSLDMVTIYNCKKFKEYKNEIGRI